MLHTVATQLSSLIMDPNHFCSTLFFRVKRIEPLFLAWSEKYLGYKTAIHMWKQMQNSPLCYDFFLASYSESLAFIPSGILSSAITEELLQLTI